MAGLADLVARATPGPWFADGSEIFIPDAMGYPIQIAELVDGGDMASMAQLEADAQLIALAPQLATLAGEMAGALADILGPLKVATNNGSVRDETVLPVDITMGELRRAWAALASFKELTNEH